MKNTNHIKRLLSAVLLLAFTAPCMQVFAYEDVCQGRNAMTLAGNVKLTDTDDKITLSLRDSDVKQVLRMFADRVGMNIVFHSSVSGSVTLDLVDVPINDAFDLVLQIAGINYYVQDKTLIVVAKNSPENAAFSQQEMMIFPINYVGADRIADFLNKNIFSMQRAGISGVNAATVNSATNDLIVFGMPSDAAIVEKVIAQFDREPLTKTFAVNHTTPAEMANMICDMLLPSRGISSGGSSGGESFIPREPGVSTGGAAGILTGAAADSDSSGGSGGELKLGEGIVACTVSPAATGAAAAPFDVQNLLISYFPQRGTITLMGGSEAQLRMIEKFVKANDIKQPQAYLEVSIIELNEEGSKEFSNVWSIQSANWNFTSSGSATSGGRASSPGSKEFISIQSIVDGDLEDGYATREKWYANGPYVSWTMNYVIENGKGRVLANPKILITNGQESVIDLTQDYIEEAEAEYLSSTASGSGAIGTVAWDYTIGEDLGLKVSLVPFISPDGYVTMNITPEYSTIASQVYSTGTTGNQELVATLLSRRNLDLKNVRIKDGETLVVGGLIQENETKTVHKIPVLGDLPVIGAAFRSSSTSKTKTELVIMITPRIINDGEGSVADSL